MSASPAPGTPQTATKAWASSLVVLLVWLLQRFALGDAPDVSTAVDAIRELAMAGASAAVAWATTYLTSNRAKAG